MNSKKGLPSLIINTSISKEQEEYKDIINKFDNSIILLQDRVVLKIEMLSKELEYLYKDIGNAYGIVEFNKDGILEFIDNNNNIGLYMNFFIISTMYMFVLYFISAILDVIMLAILGYIVSRIMGIKIRFKAVFNMGVYALTLPIILNLIYIVVNAFTGFEVKYFNWMYTTISYIYMIVAILMIKADFINKQAELMKIIEEQEKVKQEIEENERKKKEEENKELKDNKEDKPKDENEDNPKDKKREDKELKKKKEDNKSDGEDLNGLAPQG